MKVFPSLRHPIQSEKVFHSACRLATPAAAAAIDIRLVSNWQSACWKAKDDAEGTEMALAEITKQGLKTIGILVLILWGCLFAERQYMRRAERDLHVAVKSVYQLKQQRTMTPASKPMPAKLNASKALLG